jgi:hypothetical protein
MRWRLLIITVVAFFSSNFLLNHSTPIPRITPLQVIEQGQDFIHISWNLPDLQTTALTADGKSFVQTSFAGCNHSQLFGDFDLPFKSFLLGIPDKANVTYEISAIVTEVIEDIPLAPAASIGRDKNGISISSIVSAPFTPLTTPSSLEISEQEYFRDLPLVNVNFYPIQYDPGRKELRIIKSAILKFTFKEGSGKGTPFSPRSKLDHLYKDMVLNFDQSKNWLVREPKSIRKSVFAFSGPWYRIEVTKEGLYKINASTLSAAGIDIANLDPRSIRIYNHGGKPLDTKTSTLIENPEGPLENAIFVSGEEDGRFDSNDYILFYGTGAGGWYYSPSKHDFEFIQHPYDTKNHYWLTYGNDIGKRMAVEESPSSGAGITDTYFLERVHFEEDRSNLLASGADWYGYQFFGKAHDVSLNYSLNDLSTTPIQAEMTIKFKGGSGLIYLDNDPYRYYFSVWINPDKAPSPIITNGQLREELSVEWTRTFNSTDYLVEGTNAVYIQYTANFESCTAYLDWVEFLYPRDFLAINNHLSFYTNSLGQIVHYSLDGFTDNNVLLFDISDPVAVKILQTGSAVQGGVINFNLDLSDNEPKRLLATTPNSNEITNISTLSSYQPDENLMDPSHSADLIIISPRSFKSYAEEIVELRANETKPLNGKVVNLDDIYFYFSSGVKDVIAIRNFIRYAYYNWASPQPAYILLFGDGHYDYRNIVLPDTNWVPPFEISADLQLNSRETDNFYVDVNFDLNNFGSIRPDLAVGRLPAESQLDARRIVDKLVGYSKNNSRDGWQTMLTFVADDEVTNRSKSEWVHQKDTEEMAELSALNKFIKKKIYISAYESVPGGFGRVKPKANQAIIDQLNEGTLLINYAGHGAPTTWAHESVLEMTRDLNRIQNGHKLPLWIAATCDFGKYDDPHDPSFTEALVWQEDKGAIAVISSSRLVYANLNNRFNIACLNNLFPGGGPSRRLGDVLLLSTLSGDNDQKYHLFGDPSMYLADPRSHVQVTAISPDTLKALSKVSVSGFVSPTAGMEKSNDFSGGAFLIINDARYDSVNTGGPYDYILYGPRIFKGEISVVEGLFSGEFIVPKSIRYHHLPTGRATVYAWNENGSGEAIGYVDTLLFVGTSAGSSDSEGPEISLYFEGQEDFRAGDLVRRNPVLLAEIFDANGINLTQEVGHKIEIQINDDAFRDITSFFAYDRNSYAEGKLSYHLDELKPGEHQLKLEAWDNLNNPSREEIDFRVVEKEGLVLRDVVNYPNPFSDETNLTFQLLGTDAGTDIKIKVYTIAGRLVKSMTNLAPPSDGFNYYFWNGRDDDGDEMANGVYIYKVIVKNDDQQEEVIEKLVILR